MNFEDIIGFICRTEQDWIDAQLILFKKELGWQDNDSIDARKIHFTHYEFPRILFINYNRSNTISWEKLEDFQNYTERKKPHKLIEASVLIRNYKLKKIPTL